MANDCCGDMVVVSKSKDAIERFYRIMNYNDEEFFCYRVRGFDSVSDIERDADGYYRARYTCDSAWSSQNWYEDDDDPTRLLHLGYETEERVNSEGKKYTIENFEKPIYGTAHYTSITHLCKVLGLGVEMWSTEPGCQFEEYATCDHNGNYEYTCEDYEEKYPEDENGEPDYNAEPEEVHGFGDDFGCFRDSSEIYGG